MPAITAAARSPSLAVADCDAITAAIALSRQTPGQAPPAVLNFANAFQRGGGYLTGALAQEEDLCRSAPGLYPALVRATYPLDPATALATTAMIHRASNTYTLLQSPTPATIITAAAVDMRPPQPGEPPQPKTAAYRADMQRRVRAILHAAHAKGCRQLVLGAWGCGVFQNDAHTIAQLFGDALRSAEWRFRFDAVVFAIPAAGRGTINSIFRRRLDILTR